MHVQSVKGHNRISILIPPLRDQLTCFVSFSVGAIFRFQTCQRDVECLEDVNLFLHYRRINKKKSSG